jgi:hypothetical protein
MASRIYIVEIGTEVKLVEAISKAAARNHALKEMASVRIASAKDAAELVAEGKKIEVAGKDE